MFTGIIRHIGTIKEKTRRGREARVSVRSPEIVAQIEVGSSVSTSGVCLTATEVSAQGFSADLSEETLKRCTLDASSPGDAVNLEPSLRVGDEVGGHFVFGHVDAVGKVLALDRIGDGWELHVAYPAEMACFIAEKGSVAVDGVSLTVARLEDRTFTVAVVPYTYENTTLRGLKAGAGVNLEADMLARYVERALRVGSPSKVESGQQNLTREFLAEHGFRS